MLYSSMKLRILSNGNCDWLSSVINDIFTWPQAFARFMAVLLSTDATSKEEVAGLASHLHLILQLAKDLGGRQWLKYDSEFREWAAAKNMNVG